MDGVGMVAAENSHRTEKRGVQKTTRRGRMSLVLFPSSKLFLLCFRVSLGCVRKGGSGEGGGGAGAMPHQREDQNSSCALFLSIIFVLMLFGSGGDQSANSRQLHTVRHPSVCLRSDLPGNPPHPPRTHSFRPARRPTGVPCGCSVRFCAWLGGLLCVLSARRDSAPRGHLVWLTV